MAPAARVRYVSAQVDTVLDENVHKADAADRRGWRRSAVVCTLVAIGSCLLAVAVLVPTYGAARLKVIPLDVQSATVSVAEDAAVLKATSVAMKGPVKTDRGVPLRIQVYVTTENPVSADSTTLQAAQKTVRTDWGDGLGLVSAMVDRVTIDRRSGMPLAEPVPTTQAELGKPPTETPRAGIQYKFPFDVEKVSYPYYDGTARETHSIEYVDDDRVVDGMRLYHFQQTIGPVNLGKSIGSVATTTLPAEKWGLPGTEPITMDLHYSTTRDVWVEPASGAIVAVEEQPRRWLARSINDPNAVTTLEAHTHFDYETINGLAQQAKDARTAILWGTRYGPALSAVAGIVLVGTALMLARRWSRR